MPGLAACFSGRMNLIHFKPPFPPPPSPRPTQFRCPSACPPPNRLPPINRWEGLPFHQAHQLLLTLGRKPTALAPKRSRHTLGPPSPPALGPVPQGAVAGLGPGTCPPCWKGRPLPGRVPSRPRPAASSLSDSPGYICRSRNAGPAVSPSVWDAYVCCLFSSLEYSFLKAGPSSVLFTPEPSEPKAGLATSRCFLGMNEWLEFHLTPFTIRP